MKRREMLALLGGSAAALSLPGYAAQEGRKLFADDNLMAWCIVPFDAKKRGPEERAEMMARLGFRHYAYDWRAEHLPQLDRELDALQKHQVALDAFWFPFGAEPEKEEHVRTILDFLRRRGAKPQLWLSTGVAEAEASQAQRIELAARPIGWVAAEAEKLGCKVALYNHGGWYGEPENQIAIIERLQRPNVGIVYNFHHGHPHVDRFAELMPKMKPHLLALNLNGMRKDGPKILPIGQGDRDVELLRIVKKSGYTGPIGILGHREELDAEEALRLNLDGLRKIRGQVE
ncbi:MAG: sugar phosphate isomerase/epimerase family protein [Armatimonadota bacterium]